MADAGVAHQLMHAHDFQGAAAVASTLLSCNNEAAVPLFLIRVGARRARLCVETTGDHCCQAVAEIMSRGGDHHLPLVRFFRTMINLAAKTTKHGNKVGCFAPWARRDGARIVTRVAAASTRVRHSWSWPPISRPTKWSKRLMPT